MALNLHVADTLGIDRDSYADVIAAAEAISVSNESIASSFKNVLDLFIRTGNIFKTSIFRMRNSIKVSELEKYVNDHTLIVKSADNLNYFDVQDLPADIPFGMKGKYLPNVEMLHDILKSLDAVAMINVALKSFTKIREQYLRNEDITAEVNNLYDTLNVKRGMLDKAAKDIDAVFTKTNRTAKFKDVFGSMDEFRSTKTKTIEAEQYLENAKELSDRCQQLCGTITDITALKDAQMSTGVKHQMAESAMLVARICDTYGTCSLHLMSISHNLTLIYNTLYTVVK